MAAGAAAGEEAARKVWYTIHHIPGSNNVPAVPKTSFRIPGFSRPLVPRYRRLYAKFTVGEEIQRCDLDTKRDLDFIVQAGSKVNIELYAEHRLSDDECIASEVYDLAALPKVDERVSLKPCKGDSAPGLTIRVDVVDAIDDAHAIALANPLSLSRKWIVMLRSTRTVVKIGSVIAEANPIAKAVLSLVELGVEDIEKRKEYQDDILSLVDKITAAANLVLNSDRRVFAEKREEQARACNALVPEIYCTLSFIQSLTSQSLVARLRRSVNERVQELHQRLQKVMDDVESGKHLDTQNAIFRVEDIVTRLDIDNTLSHLPVAEGMQAGSSKACLPNTRVKLLEAIMDWVFAPKGPRCFVLHGTAGKGKSAVAHSVASVLRGMGVVAPFFAFDRSDRARQASQLFPTLAQQLARYDRRYLERLRALRTEQLKTTDIQDQYDNLMSTTLQVSVVLAPVVFVIDALDECPNSDVGDIENRDVLLKALRKCLGDESLHRNVRFFVTTRPEQDIRLLGPSNGISITWKSIDDDEGTKADIEKFVASRLPDSSASDLVTTISEAAQDHFECAAILCRELTRPKKPMTVGKRAQLIARVKTQPGRPLYKTYRVILETHLDTKDEDCLNIYRQLLAWVFAVRQPQPRSVFLEIAAVVFPEETIEDILEGLGSLLTGTTLTSGDDTPIRPLHASFRDFCLDAEESGIFSIAPDFGTVDARLALACFQLMSRPALGLRLNICDLPSLFVFKDDVSDLAERVAKHISPALQYACRETSAHLLACAQGVEQMKVYAELDNFLTKRFLFWLEACGWLNSPPSLALQGCSRYLRSINASDLVAVVDDCIAFEKRFRGAISSSPTQIYISGPLFSPLSSHVFRSRETLPMEVSGFDAEQHWPLNEALVIDAHADVHAVAFSPDGRHIVCAAGLTVRVWDAVTGAQAGDTLQEHEHQVLSVAFSRDGTRIVSGSLDNTIRVWDMRTRQRLGDCLRYHDRSGVAFAFSPDGTRVVSGAFDKSVRTWDIETGHCLGSAVYGDGRYARHIAFSHDGTRVAFGFNDGTVEVWDADATTQVGEAFRGHEGPVISVAFSLDGTRIATGSIDATVRIWDAATGHPMGSAGLHESIVHSVAFSPNGRRIVSGSDDRTIRIWDAETGQQVGAPLHGHEDRVRSVAFSPDGTRIVSGSEDRTVRVWYAEAGHSPVGGVSRDAHWAYAIAFAPDGTKMISGSDDKSVRVWDTETGQQIGDALRGHDGPVVAVACLPNGSRVVSGSLDRTVRIWDADTGQQVGDTMRGHEDWVWCVAISPDGAYIVSGSNDRTLRVWDTKTGQQMGDVLSGHRSSVHSVAYSPRGTLIASGSSDMMIRLWDAKAKQQVGKALRGHEGVVLSIAFSPGAALIASGSADETVRIWDVSTGRQVRETMRGHKRAVRSVAFSLDGMHIVTGGEDGTVRVWDVETGRQAHIVLRGHTQWVRCIAFSPYGKTVVSSSDDKTVRVWNFAHVQRDLKAEVTDSLGEHTALMSFDSHQEPGWLGYEQDGLRRPILWIPRPFRQYPLVYSPYHIRFFPPRPHIRVRFKHSSQPEGWAFIRDLE